MKRVVNHVDTRICTGHEEIGPTISLIANEMLNWTPESAAIGTVVGPVSISHDVTPLGDNNFLVSVVGLLELI